MIRSKSDFTKGCSSGDREPGVSFLYKLIKGFVPKGSTKTIVNENHASHSHSNSKGGKKSKDKHNKAKANIIAKHGD